MTSTDRRQDLLAGLNVVDDELYSRYRAGMMPILERYGGFFRHDFRIGEVLRSEASHPINRLFVISFPDAESRDAFFEDQEYLDVRRELFDPSVEAATILATYPADVPVRGTDS